MHNILSMIALVLCADWTVHRTEAGSCDNVQVLDKEISCEVKHEIVKKHNILRQQVAKGLVKGQPRASNMREMYWDNELASGAQEWANHCTFEHNNVSDRKVERFNVGQNIGIQMSIGTDPNDEKIDFSSIIQDWFNEHKLYKYGPLIGLEGTGHYTQTIWSETYLIGCGYVKYVAEDGYTHRFYVCNYGPAGNMISKKPYEVGSTKCNGKLSASTAYRAICSTFGVGDDCTDENNVAARLFTKDGDGEECESEHCNLLRQLDEKDDDNEEDCTGDNCNTQRMLNKIVQPLQTNSDLENSLDATESNQRKMYNLITINIFHK